MHADDATVSVNFWVTPTEANLAPGRGGLVVCRAPPPDDWEIKDYDADQERIVTFLEQKAGDSLVVPYRAEPGRALPLAPVPPLGPPGIRVRLRESQDKSDACCTAR